MGILIVPLPMFGLIGLVLYMRNGSLRGYKGSIKGSVGVSTCTLVLFLLGAVETSVEFAFTFVIYENDTRNLGSESLRFFLSGVTLLLYGFVNLNFFSVGDSLKLSSFCKPKVWASSNDSVGLSVRLTRSLAIVLVPFLFAIRE